MPDRPTDRMEERPKRSLLSGKYLPLLATALTAVIVLAVAVLLREYLLQQIMERERAALWKRISSRATSLENSLQSRLALAYSMAALYAVNPDFTQEQFEDFAGDLLASETDIERVMFVRGAEIAHEYPTRPDMRKGSRDLQDFDLLFAAAQQAQTARHSEIAGPFQEDGDLLVAALAPVWRDNRDGVLADGFSIVVFNLSRILNEMEKADSVAANNLFALRAPQAGANGEFITYGEQSVFEPMFTPVSAEVHTPSGLWILASEPFGGWLVDYEPRLMWVRITFVIFEILICALVWILTSSPRRLRMAVNLATANLKESERRFRTLLDASFEGIVVHDETGLLDCNRVYERMSGYSAEELRAGKLLEMVYAPDQRNIVREKILTHDDRPYEVTMQRRDGSSLDVEVVGRLIRLNGRSARVAAVRDIAERKKAERQLKKRVEFEELIATISTHFINIPAGELEPAMRQAIAQLGAKLEMDCGFLCLTGDRQETAMTVHEWVADPSSPIDGIVTREQPLTRFPWLHERIERLETVYVRAPESLPAEASHLRVQMEAVGARSLACVPLVFGGRLIGCLGYESHREHRNWTEDFVALLNVAGEIFSNALERQRAEQSLHEANVGLDHANRRLQNYSADLEAMVQERTAELDAQKERALDASRAKSEFLSVISHELRTPLNSIIGLTQVVLMKVSADLPEQHRENLRNILSSGKRLLELIDKLLDLTRIEAGRMQAQVSQFMVDSLVAEVADIIAPLTRRAGLELIARNDARGVMMRSDRHKIVQVLVNLMGNAVKFTAKGSVELSVTRRGRALTFTVRDTGIGIGEKEQAFIFDRFRQVDASPTRRYEGSGLGLAISRDLATLLGGEIAIESEKGVGSTFYFTLPIERGMTESAPAIDVEIEAASQ